MNNNTIILGIDHGYGNIKTAHTCFPTGVTAHKKEPTFHNDLLIYNDHFYTIGEGHKEFTADKMMDEDYYVLTLAAIARELELRRLTSARVYLAVGLPLTWVGEQAVIAAVNAYFSRKEQLEADPYLETREKEDAFLEKVMETLQEGLRQATVPGLVPLLQLLQGAQAGTPAPAKEPEANTGTDWDAALDFAGSF